MSVGSEIGIAVGVAGLGLAVFREWLAGRDRRRARPVVICHEDRKRHWTDQPTGVHDAASVHLTNESASSAFNIRFGIYVDDVAVGWRDAADDKKPSRVNVLPPQGRWPEAGSVEVRIPEEVLWSIGTDRDPDEGRSYWALYQSPTGDWWLTVNPAGRGDDLIVKRTRRRGFWNRHDRWIADSMIEGKWVMREAVRGLSERAEAEKTRENERSSRE